MIYETRFRVTAIQYRSISDQLAVSKFAKAKTRTIAKAALVFEDIAMAHMLTMFPGDWLVKVGDCFIVYSNNEFSRTFKAVV
jgi:hypothetical protein